jgi:glutaredoxin 3
MIKIEIYSASYCPSCRNAKILLDKKNLQYKELKIDENPELRDQMLKRKNNIRTIPQIFIENEHIGGYDQLLQLELTGELDILLNKYK